MTGVSLCLWILYFTSTSQYYFPSLSAPSQPHTQFILDYSGLESFISLHSHGKPEKARVEYFRVPESIRLWCNASRLSSGETVPPETKPCLEDYCVLFQNGSFLLPLPEAWQDFSPILAVRPKEFHNVNLTKVCVPSPLKGFYLDDCFFPGIFISKTCLCWDSSN